MKSAASKSLFKKDRRAVKPGGKLGLVNDAAETRRARIVGYRP